MRRLLFIALLASFLVGCAEDEKRTDAPTEESTSGGEAPPDYEPEWPEDDGRTSSDAEDVRGAPEGSGGDREASGTAEADPEEPEESPWGKTKSEQCAPPPRPSIAPAAERSIAEGAAAARAGRTDDARGHFERAIASDPKAYPAHHNLGVLADRAGDERRAAEHYRRAQEIAPDYAPAVRGSATLALRRGSVHDALAIVTPLGKRYRTSLDLQALHAELLVRAGRHEEAWAVGRRVLECDERHVPTLKAIIHASRAEGRDELAESVLGQALAIDETDAELHFIKGQLLETKPGRVREAIEEYRRAVEVRPSYAEARMALGKLELGAGNYGDAVTHFEAVDRVVPGTLEVKLNLADAYRSARRYQEALRVFEEVLEKNPNLPEAHFNLGLMYQTQGFALPGMDELAALRKAKEAFTAYRDAMGPKLGRGDPAEEYLGAINRRMQRIEEAQRREAEAERRRESEDDEPQEDDDVIFFD